MEFHHVLVITLLTVFHLIADCCSEDECKFQYLRQPPTTTTDNCNPYQEYIQKHTIEISMECFILAKKNLNGTFQIKWFKENMTEDLVDLGLGFPEHQIIHSSDDFITNSRYHDKSFRHQQYNPSFLGKYWCQVINTTADSYQPLMRSNVFTLLPPDNYTGLGCRSMNLSVQFIDNKKCADMLATAYTSTENHQTKHYSYVASIISDRTISKAVEVTTSLPTTRKPVSTVYIVTGVSGGVLVLLALIITSTLIVMLIVMKKRKTQAKTTENFNSYWVNKNNIEYCESDANASSQPVIYAVPDQTREVNTNKEKDSSNGEYHYLGDVATGAAMFDDRTYDDVGASNSPYLHLEDAVTIGVDTEYSKLSHDGNYKQDVHVPHSRNDHDSNRPASHDMQEYSSLNHHPPPPTIDSNYHKLSHKDTTLQQYSSLQHHTMSHTTNSDNTVTSDQQQYSVLNNI